MLGNLGVTGDARYAFRNVYHLSAGAIFPLGTDFHFRPSLLVAYSENLRPQAEASALVFIKRVFGIGANVRSYGDLAGMVQFNFAGIGVGYAYQFNPKKDRKHTSELQSLMRISYAF